MHLARLVALLTAALSTLAIAAPGDAPGCVDHPLLPTRMPGYVLEKCATREFDFYEFKVLKGPKTRVEGRLTLLTYRVTDRKDEQSGLAVVRNYDNALTSIGGAVAASDNARWINGSVTVDGREVWVQAERGNGLIWLVIVEKQAMKQHVTADAAAFAKDLASTGHVAVYGITFDTGKAVVKPESEAALNEVARLLQTDASLKLWVVGHTDTVGIVKDNLALSEARAKAVITALTGAHGVAAARLEGYGVGPLAPVASNQTDEGRAKNRRVELVRQ
jgi:outer membrane protein OmpA-like peptidoglycan-associated protein